MKERPILFSGAMVRAILAGTKTQTRRVVKPQPPADKQRSAWYEPGIMGWAPPEIPSQHWHRVRCPYGQPGDRLWVRESFWLDREGVAYKADQECGSPWLEAGAYKAMRTAENGTPYVSNWGWRPSIHMPRWASRITLVVTGVRVERLQDISEADAQAEGARECDPVSGREVLLAGPSQRGSFVLHYRDIWEQINGAGSWEANPWVWVVEFKRLEARHG